MSDLGVLLSVWVYQGMLVVELSLKEMGPWGMEEGQKYTPPYCGVIPVRVPRSVCEGGWVVRTSFRTACDNNIHSH